MGYYGHLLTKKRHVLVCTNRDQLESAERLCFGAEATTASGGCNVIDFGIGPA